MDEQDTYLGLVQRERAIQSVTSVHSCRSMVSTTGIISVDEVTELALEVEGEGGGAELTDT